MHGNASALTRRKLNEYGGVILFILAMSVEGDSICKHPHVIQGHSKQHHKNPSSRQATQCVNPPI